MIALDYCKSWSVALKEAHPIGDWDDSLTTTSQYINNLHSPVIILLIYYLNMINYNSQ